MSTPLQQFRDHSNIPFEVFITIFTLLPIVVLVYFYSHLPERIPEYLNLNGEVAVWGSKGFVSVFRLPLMAVDLQILCLLTKYGVGQRLPASTIESTDELAALREQSFRLTSNLFDWLRAFIAIKLAASSLEIIFYSFERFHSFTAVTRTTSWVTSILGVGGALFYSYRLMRINHELKKHSAKDPLTTNQSKPDTSLFYYNPGDPAWFSDKHLPNFGNKWVYIYLTCLLCLPVLMFWPMLSP